SGSSLFPILGMLSIVSLRGGGGRSGGIAARVLRVLNGRLLQHLEPEKRAFVSRGGSREAEGFEDVLVPEAHDSGDVHTRNLLRQNRRRSLAYRTALAAELHRRNLPPLQFDVQADEVAARRDTLFVGDVGV